MIILKQFPNIIVDEGVSLNEAERARLQVFVVVAAAPAAPAAVVAAPAAPAAAPAA